MSSLVAAGNLKVSAFAWVQAQQFRKNAEQLLADSRRPMISTTGMFLLAYECIHTACVGYLFAHGLAPDNGPGHRQNLLELALNELDIPETECDEALDAHRTRNELTYRKPAPPVSHQEATDLVAIAQRVMTQARVKLPDWFDDGTPPAPPAVPVLVPAPKKS